MKGKYEEWITEDGLAMLRGWAREGYTDDEISKLKLHINPATLCEWKNRFPQIAEAIKKGRGPWVEAVEEAAYKGATGYYVEEIDTEIVELPGGESRRRINKHKRWIPANAALVCYVLNNRRADRWSNHPEKVETEEIEDDGLIMALTMTQKGLFEDGDDSAMIKEAEDEIGGI